MPKRTLLLGLFLRFWGGFPPATPEWLSLNAPLSMARALRAIAFNP